jgi:ribosomal protein S14
VLLLYERVDSVFHLFDWVALATALLSATHVRAYTDSIIRMTKSRNDNTNMKCPIERASERGKKKKKNKKKKKKRRCWLTWARAVVRLLGLARIAADEPMSRGPLTTVNAAAWQGHQGHHREKQRGANLRRAETAAATGKPLHQTAPRATRRHTIQRRVSDISDRREPRAHDSDHRTVGGESAVSLGYDVHLAKT